MVTCESKWPVDSKVYSCKNRYNRVLCLFTRFQEIRQITLTLCSEYRRKESRAGLPVTFLRVISRVTEVGEDHFYAQELFQQEELKGYLKITLETQKSVYTHVVYDSAGIEKTFAEDLEKNEQVKDYTKLPSWFKVPTPLGTYNPDWAVVVEDNGIEKLYFVVETKGSTWWGDLRHAEGAKIKCGEKHFEKVANDVDNSAQYIKATDVEGMMDYVE